MQLTIESLQKAGAFVGAPVFRQVEWSQNGELQKADVWVRPLSYQAVNADMQSIRSGEGAWPRRIASSICLEDGTPVFQLSDITGVGADGKPIMETKDGVERERGALNYALFDALVMLVIEVSGLGKKRANSSQGRSSGTSSSSTASAAARSKKRKRG